MTPDYNASTQSSNAASNAASNATVSAAAAGVAHDLNNQFTLIVNHLAARDTRAAMEIVMRCSQLTANLLQVSRGTPLKLAPVNPVTLVREFAGRLRLPDGVRLFLSTPTPVPDILANPEAINRVLANLVLNACQAMEQGGVLRLAVSCDCIEVADSGPGIDPELADRVFEPFFTTRGERGHGLGLHIVRDIMRRHSGTVSLHNKPGRGARFALHFRPADVTPQGKVRKGSPRKIAPAA